MTGENFIAIGPGKNHFQDDRKTSVWPLRNCIETP